MQVCDQSTDEMADDSGNERRDRVLLRPWLESMLENGNIPGLEWYDKEKMMFKVPWKHRSKKDWSLKHSSVFLAWAQNTGRWTEGDPAPYFAQLKTRLRCAFNKAPDIEEMKEHHARNCEEPYKVYRFTTRRDNRAHGRKGAVRTTVPMTARRVRQSTGRAQYTNTPHSGAVSSSVVENLPANICVTSEVKPTAASLSMSYQRILASNVPFQQFFMMQPAYEETVITKGVSLSAMVQLQSPTEQHEIMDDLEDKKVSIIPLSVELMSSTDSDDSADHQLDTVPQPVKAHGKGPRYVTEASDQTPSILANASSKLLLLQRASEFVEQASRQQSEDEASTDGSLMEKKGSGASEADSRPAEDASKSQPATSSSTDTGHPVGEGQAPNYATEVCIYTIEKNETTANSGQQQQLSEVMDLTAPKRVEISQTVASAAELPDRILPLPKMFATSISSPVSSVFPTILSSAMLAKPLTLPVQTPVRLIATIPNIAGFPPGHLPRIAFMAGQSPVRVLPAGLVPFAGPAVQSPIPSPTIGGMVQSVGSLVRPPVARKAAKDDAKMKLGGLPQPSSRGDGGVEVMGAVESTAQPATASIGHLFNKRLVTKAYELQQKEKELQLLERNLKETRQGNSNERST